METRPPWTMLLLTAKEKRLADLLIAGKNFHEAADQLGMTYVAVYKAYKRLLDKLRVNSLGELVARLRKAA